MNKKILFLRLTLTTSLVSMEINHSVFSMFKSRKEFSKAALAVKPIVKKEIEKLKKITKIIKKPKIE